MNKGDHQATSVPLMNSRQRIRKRVVSCRKAALLLVSLAMTSRTDTIHAFSESFSCLQRTAQHSRVDSDAGSLTCNSFLVKEGCALRTKSTSLSYAPNHPTSQTGPMVAKAFYTSHKLNRNPTKPKTRSGANLPLSNSVLSSSDTLPSFPTAHGLLSPETVMRMEVMTNNKKGRDKALDTFLDTYKKEGPMACLPMLSDENVLPRLTEAMRDILM